MEIVDPQLLAVKLPPMSLPRLRLFDWAIWIVIIGVIAASLILFFAYVNPSLSGENGLRIGADSAFYLWRAGLVHTNSNGGDFDQTLGLISASSNYAGPVLIAELLRSNFLIVLFNYVLFF